MVGLLCKTPGSGPYLPLRSGPVTHSVGSSLIQAHNSFATSLTRQRPAVKEGKKERQRIPPTAFAREEETPSPPPPVFDVASTQQEAATLALATAVRRARKQNLPLRERIVFLEQQKLSREPAISKSPAQLKYASSFQQRRSPAYKIRTARISLPFTDAWHDDVRI
ncbi:hypothetical protein CF327_g6899 [Tilletia walkeri]|nr:hypothetical protein CF327_g6899 [Tilletia walkeri]